MLFRRRERESLGARLRLYVWPRRSFARSIRYFYKRTVRLTATPHAIGMGVAAGAFASFFPFGLHFVMALVLAWLLAGNLVAAALGTALGNPLTFPVMWTASYQLGRVILGDAAIRPVEGSLASMFRHPDLVQLWEPVLKPIAVGAVPLGLVVAFVFYVLARSAATAFQNNRRQRMKRRPERLTDTGAGA
jgi:uncharacterized protein (DUF2062 family)